MHDSSIAHALRAIVDDNYQLSQPILSTVITPAATAAIQHKYRAIAISASKTLVRTKISPIPKRKDNSTYVTYKESFCLGSVSHVRSTARKRNKVKENLHQIRIKIQNYKKAQKSKWQKQNKAI